MDTTRNRSRVLAQLLRGALSEMEQSSAPGGQRRLIVDAVRYHTAVQSIDAIAAELESVALGAAPDPAGSRHA